MPLQSVTSAATNRIGTSPTGALVGTRVYGIFLDEAQQYPIMLGTVGGIPSTPTAIGDDDSGEVNSDVRTKDIVLRTIDGPVTGKQLTFIDKETGQTNLTGNLKANMKVVGFGLPDNTYIVTIDGPTQITINNQVTGYGENIITFQDPPSNIDAVNKSKLEIGRAHV